MWYRSNYFQSKVGLSNIFLNTRSNKNHEEVLKQKALEILQFVGLTEYASESALTLPHGRQRLLCLAIALATEPQLLLLDEPITGMNAEEVETMLCIIRDVREKRESHASSSNIT